MIEPLESEVQALHALYCQYVNFRLTLNFSNREAWQRFIVAGYTIEDLRIVMTRGCKQIAKGIDSGVIRFSNIIRDLDRFGETLACAKAEQRIKREGPTPREKALNELRPIVVEPRTNGVEAKAAREVALRAIDNMRKELNGN